MPNPLTKSGRATRKCEACLASLESSFSSIAITEERSQRLQQLVEEAYKQHCLQPPTLRTKAVNLSSELDAWLLASGLRSAISWPVTIAPATATDPKDSRKVPTATKAGAEGPSTGGSPAQSSATDPDSGTSSSTRSSKGFKWPALKKKTPEVVPTDLPSNHQQQQHTSAHTALQSTGTPGSSESDSSINRTSSSNSRTEGFDPVALLQASSIPPDCNLVLIELAPGAARLSYAERCVAAFAVLSCVPVVFVAAEACGALDEAAASTAGRVWGVCRSYWELEQRMQGDLPKAAALRGALLTDIQALLEPYKQVDKVSHFAKRGAVALVPGGVHAVNAMGLVRLAKRVLKVTGMGRSKQARKAVGSSAAAGGAKVTAIDSLSDVYQFIVQGSIAADAVSAAADAVDVTAGIAAAADTISVFDAFTLGTVCVVTGMVSAWGAAVCRPSTVDGMARVIAAQQLVAALRPGLRERADSGSSDE